MASGETVPAESNGQPESGTRLRWGRLGIPTLPAWCFQPDAGSPGLYLQCETIEQRKAIMLLLGVPHAE